MTTPSQFGTATSPSRKTAEDEDFGSLKPNVLLVLLPVVIAFGNVHTSAALVGTIVIGAIALVSTHQTAARIELGAMSFALPVAGLAIALRPNFPDTMVSAIFYVAGSVAMALTVLMTRSRQIAIVSLVDGIGLLLVAAVFLRFTGIGVGGRGPAVLGNIFTGGERVLFPLAGSLTSAPALAAGYLVAAIPILVRTDRYRFYRLCAVAAALYVLIQGDRRSALVSAVLILALALLLPRRLRQFAPLAIGVLLTTPIWLKLTGGLDVQFRLQTSFLSRSQGIGRGTDSLEGRFEIWSRAIEFYTDRIDWLHQAFGYGTSGQAVSGASVTYRSLFTETAADRNSKSPHNSVLQSLFDGGWIVTAVFVFAVVYLAWVFSRRVTTVDLAALAMLTALSVVGSSEAIMSPGRPQPVWWTVMALGMIGFSKAQEAQRALPTVT